MLIVLIKNQKVMRSFLFILFGIQCMGQANAFYPENATTPNYSANSLNQYSQKPNKEIIILIHGLLRTSLSMWPLKNYLKRQGYEVYSYSYPSAKYSIQEHGMFLNRFIRNLLANNPGVKINFITHSLGGIITREALANFTPKQLKNIGSLIMMAPPNQGSVLAKLSVKMFPLVTSTIKPLAELSSEKTSYVHYVSVPNVKIEIIAGRYDAKVPPKFAYLSGQNAPIVVNSNHTFIMNNAQTRQLIMNFLKKESL
jgi:esterase/lipase